MKRSQINAIIKDFEAMLREYRFALPPFLSFTPEEWKEKGHEYDEIRDNALGWDITDYGEGNFAEKGLSLITIRNGNVHDPKYTKTYAEKIMMLYPGQVSPNHFHWNKMEDIINRGGGRLAFRLYNSTPDNKLADTPVTVYRDGVKYVIPAGEVFDIGNGESVTLTQGVYHEFWGVEGTGLVMVGEVSVVNDDHNDNIFLVAQKRFPSIEEDEAPYRLLCSDYDKFLK